MKIRELTGADFEPLSRLVGDLWHAHHGGRAYWYGADEVCAHLSKAHQAFVAQQDGAFAGAILVAGPRKEDQNESMRMHWLQQRTRIAAMCNALGFNVREDVEVLNREQQLADAAREALGANAGEIVLLVVCEEARGRGIGKALLRAGVAWLKDHGANAVCLVTDETCNWQLYDHLRMERMTVDEDAQKEGIYLYWSQADALLGRLL